MKNNKLFKPVLNTTLLFFFLFHCTFSYAQVAFNVDRLGQLIKAEPDLDKSGKLIIIIKFS